MGDFADWSASKLYAVGGSVFLASFVFLAYALVKTGKRRRMTHQELKERILNDDITDMPTVSVAGPGTGVVVEANANLGTLRKAAAEGEWGLFFSWPAMVFCMCAGTQLFLIGAAIESKAAWVAWVGAVFLVPGILVSLFMPFAALFTKIDAHTNDPDAELPEWLKNR